MDAPELAREVNKRIYEVAAKYGDDIELDFLCECGCIEITPRRPSDYSAAEAFRDGHESRTLAAAPHSSLVVMRAGRPISARFSPGCASSRSDEWSLLERSQDNLS
jgi:hypothetical protein